MNLASVRGPSKKMLQGINYFITFLNWRLKIEMRDPQRRIAVFSSTLKVIRRVGILVPLVVIAIVAFGIVNPRFLLYINIESVARQTTFLAILAIGSMFPLLVSGFDLSIGSIISLISVISTLVMKMGIFDSDINMKPWSVWSMA